MNRDAFKKLLEWKESASKKPILLRGARQVGKSWLARELGKTFEFFIEINFEQKPALKKIFDLDLDPARIARDIQIASGSTLVAGRTLLFLDETQECPNALKALRYFYEQMPDLHVLAAGSLLDFTIEEIGLPVGRVSSLYLHPMSFGEFLDAAGHEKLRQEIINDGAMSVSSFLHLRLMSLLGQYLAVGGMPESVAAWIETRDFNKSAEALSALADAYRQDFSKYSRTKQQ